MDAIKFFLNEGYEKKQIIVVDGWDQEYINQDIANLCTYYKREMKDHHEEYAQPISFAFPKEKISSTKFYKGIPKSSNHNTGYKGRTAIHEIMEINSVVRNLIYKNADQDALFEQV